MHTAVFNDAVIIEARAGTTGFCGGDGGTGGRTVIEIQTLMPGEDIKFEVFNDGGAMRIKLKGDAELRTFVGALEFVAQKLKEQAGLQQMRREFLSVEEWKQKVEGAGWTK